MKKKNSSRILVTIGALFFLGIFFIFSYTAVVDTLKKVGIFFVSPNTAAVNTVNTVNTVGEIGGE